MKKITPLLGLLVTLVLMLVSCESADLVNPTAAELDQRDVNWGLPKRVSRGGSKVQPLNAAPTVTPPANNLPTYRADGTKVSQATAPSLAADPLR
jgi:hypothetical protein